MKKLIQNLGNGKTEIIDVPKPNLGDNDVLIKTTHSLISLGTERMLVDFAKSNIISKAMKQPEKVKMVLDKIKSDGLMNTLGVVFNKLDEPISLGYCNAGIVDQVGKKVNEFSVGDRVVSNGEHSEFVRINKNLVAKIPNDVKSEDAVFTVIGSIALQGIRLCKPTFGETIVVYGLGLIGLITVQLLKANGCNVIGVDIDEDKCKLANQFGITSLNPKFDDIESAIYDINKNDADGVIITASTNSNELISQSANICRKRGRIILVGVIGLDINRADFYEKEISFQVSCSYGPGRYDSNYEEKSNDYPIGFVRWTEKRNFECILESISKKSLEFEKLKPKIKQFEECDTVYDDITKSKSIATILRYKDKVSNVKTVKLKERKLQSRGCSLGIIGSGNFTKSTILPELQKTKAQFMGISSFDGLSSTLLGKKYNFSYSTSDYLKIINDEKINTVLITTRHNTHAKIIQEALKKNKNIFVEKPLAISKKDIDEIISTYNAFPKSSLMVGFNRRFSPHATKIRHYTKNISDINIVATMNAGFIEKDHWVQDMEIGGGRIIGEACHFIDLCVYLTGSKVSHICMNSMGTNNLNTDNASILLKFENGANASLNYFANGAKSYSKERVEVYFNNSTIILDNFINTKGYNIPGFKNYKSSIDKGHKEQFKLYIDSINNNSGSIIGFEEIINVSQASIAATESLKHKSWQKVV